MSESVEQSFDKPQRVVGVMARVSNSAPEKIGDIWRRFHGEKIGDRLSGRGEDIYSVYFDYESDEKGEYGVVVGYMLPDDAAVPDGLGEVMLAPGRYEVFDVAGPLPESVWKKWAEIWNTPLRRTYRTDFDCYGADGLVKIYVGVR